MRKKMTPVSFLIYTLVGLAAAAITANCMSGGEGEWRPEYRAFVKAHDRWVGDRDRFAAGVVQRHFEEGLTGVFPIEQLPNADLQEVARAAKAWAKDHDPILGTTDSARLAGAKNLVDAIYFWDSGPRLTDRVWRERQLIRCSRSGCTLDAPVSILGDPHRLVLALNGDRAGIQANLPTGTEFTVPEPTFPPNAPRTFASTWRDDARLWAWSSLFFIAAFLLAGLIAHYLMEEEVDGKTLPVGAHPLAVPDFVLGWLVMLAFAPGFLLVHGFMASIRDARPGMDRVRRFVRPGKFADEFADLKAQLEELRTHEKDRGDSSLLRDIDALIKKVGESQSQRHLDELREALAAADRVRVSLEEVNRELDASAA